MSSLFPLRKITTLLFLFFMGVAALNAQHYKKDGTPDRRYSEHRSPNYKNHSTYHPKASYKKGPYTKKATKYSSARRDKNGKIIRSSAAKNEFMRKTGYPHGRKGYVVDHIRPLKKGGCDCPSNMQWQTIEQAKAKDKWE
jgi:hypothetical protein